MQIQMDYILQHYYVLIIFKTLYKPLVQEGRIYISMPPLYRIDCGKDVFMPLMIIKEMTIVAEFKKKKGKPKINIQRFKGLGEMNPHHN